MLIQFRFQNFKSFRDDTILDLSATKMTEFSDRIVSACGEKILPTAVIFGANASGKSNVIQAFRYMSRYVMESFSYGGDAKGEETDSRKMKCKPFLFDPVSREADSSFEVYFVSMDGEKCKLYNYGFAINQWGITEEWLNSKAKTAREYTRIFYRDNKELDLQGIPVNSQENIRIALEKETLVASLGAKLKIAKLKIVRDWFSGVRFADFGNPYENAIRSTIVPPGFVEDETVRKQVVSYFSSFDSSIADFNAEMSDDGDRCKIEAIHRGVDGGRVAIPLREESSGTLKMFALYPILQKTLEKGGVLFVDELNARLHPLLVRNFLITFLNPEINRNHAQLVFTSHDSWQLSNHLLRRDEIWFTEKNEDGVTTLYSLADFISADGEKIRKDESYEKNYLLGKYGAIPTLKFLDVFKGE